MRSCTGHGLRQKRVFRQETKTTGGLIDLASRLVGDRGSELRLVKDPVGWTCPELVPRHSLKSAPLDNRSACCACQWGLAFAPWLSPRFPHEELLLPRLFVQPQKSNPPVAYGPLLLQLALLEHCRSFRVRRLLRDLMQHSRCLRGDTCKAGRMGTLCSHGPGACHMEAVSRYLESSSIPANVPSLVQHHLRGELVRNTCMADPRQVWSAPSQDCSRQGCARITMRLRQTVACSILHVIMCCETGPGRRARRDCDTAKAGGPDGT